MKQLFPLSLRSSSSVVASPSKIVFNVLFVAIFYIGLFSAAMFVFLFYKTIVLF